MGNCQAVDAATLVVEHPSGKVDRFYWGVSASEVMRTNPGHYVALLISTTVYHSQNTTNPVRLTRIKLLRPTDMLLLGHAYRLITTQEVMKGICAKKHAKMKKQQQECAETVERRSEPDKEDNKISKHRPRSSNSSGKSKTWQPSLQSISEAAT